VRQYVTHVPISPAIIKQLYQIAEAEEIPNCIKIRNRVNNVLMIMLGLQEWIMRMIKMMKMTLLLMMNQIMMMTITTMIASMMIWILMKLKALHTIQQESIENSMNMMMIKRKNTLKIIQMTMMTLLNHAMKGKQIIILMNMLTFMKMMNQILK
jgi:hypothetical protein